MNYRVGGWVVVGVGKGDEDGKYRVTTTKCKIYLIILISVDPLTGLVKLSNFVLFSFIYGV